MQDLSRALVEQGPDPESYAVVVRLAVSRFGFRDGALFIQPRGDATGLDEMLAVNAMPGTVPLAAEGPGIERLALNIGNRNLGVLVLRGGPDPLPDSEHRVLRAFSDQLALVLERDRMLRVATQARSSRLNRRSRLERSGAVDPAAVGGVPPAMPSPTMAVRSADSDVGDESATTSSPARRPSRAAG